MYICAMKNIIEKIKDALFATFIISACFVVGRFIVEIAQILFEVEMPTEIIITISGFLGAIFSVITILLISSNNK
jgi:hypothetical protein